MKSEESLEHLVDQRVLLKSAQGSVRYVGRLLNNPKAGEDMWLGIEWDEEGQGKHSGTVDGVCYFTCQFHLQSPNYPHNTKCCSFIRYGKIQVGGQSLREALVEKYRPDDMITPEEKEALAAKDKEILYVNTDKHGMKQIELVGVEKSYNWRCDVTNQYEIALEYMRISELG